MTSSRQFFALFTSVFLLLPLVSQGQGADAQEVELRLEDARQRLETAAREVAELSGQLGGEEVHRFRHKIRIDNRRAMIGVNIADKENGSGYSGVEIMGVTPDGPADNAGLESGDIITAVNGDSLLADPNERPTRKLIEIMQAVEPGSEVIVEYQRGNTTRNATVVAEKFKFRSFAFSFPDGFENFEFDPNVEVIPGIEHMRGHPMIVRQWGDLELVSLTPKLGEYFGADEGILVVRAPQDDNLQLEDGDVIVSIDGRRPASPRHALRILRSYQTGETLSLEIIRKKRTQTLEVEVPEDRLSMWRRSPPKPRRVRAPRPLPPPVGT